MIHPIVSPTEEEVFQHLQQILPSRIYAALRRAGYTTTDALRRIQTPADCLKIRGIGIQHMPILMASLPHLQQPEPTHPIARHDTPTGPSAHERTIYSLYQQHLSYRAVAKVANLPIREVIGLLEKGRKLGWWTYELPAQHRAQTLQTVIPREVLLETYRQHVSTQQVAETLSISIGMVHTLAHAYGYTPHQLSLHARRHHTSDEIEAVLSQWGRHPTAHEFRHHPDWKRLYPRVRALWRSFPGYTQWRQQQDGAMLPPTEPRHPSSPTQP